MPHKNRTPESNMCKNTIKPLFQQETLQENASKEKTSQVFAPELLCIRRKNTIFAALISIQTIYKPYSFTHLRPNRNDRKQPTKPQYRVNEQIRVREVRIVQDDAESTVMQTRDALRLAQQKGVDLVEISPNAQPPVCRLIDYSKFLYQQKKKQKELKAKQVKVEIKEIRFGPQTDDHDYNFKLKHAKGFLSEGDKVKAYVFFRGRSILFKEQGEVLLLRFANDLEDYGKVESMPVLEGKRMTMYLAPKKAPVKKEKEELPEVPAVEVETTTEEQPAPAKKAPQVKERREYTGPKVEGEDF